MSTIISIDPGGTTGLAVMYDYPDSLKIGDLSELKPPHHMLLWDTLWAVDPDIIIYEGFDWRPYRNKKVELTPVEYIGVVKLYYQIRRNKTQELIEQKPPLKEWWTNEKLKRIDEYHTGMPHAMDAVRHMLYYLMQNGEKRHLELLR